ncbi:hypothetical protein WAF17_22600 (plasmid) [Bernardetia sp. ABR2-2B]|uniref:hypothetical protein n=1 Tax=Bernardetia sp. ABR2-2B TaxID=3127472 RepID=UPI0030D2335C
MNEYRIKKVSELAAKMLINEMTELNFYQLHYDYLTFKDSIFIERERRAFAAEKDTVQAFKAAITSNIAKRLGFSSFLTVGKSQTYDTLINNSFKDAGLRKGKGAQPSKLNLYNLLPKDTFIKIDCGNRRVELIINGATVKTAFADLTPPAKRVIRNNHVNTSLSLFS